MPTHGFIAIKTPLDAQPPSQTSPTSSACCPSGATAMVASPSRLLHLTHFLITCSSLSVLSSLPTRPSIYPQTLQRPLAADDLPPSGLRLGPLSQPPISLGQIRGAKRDTYNPSHVVRKRRHGFLARVKSRTGRRILKRRRAKGRNTLSH